MSQETDNLINEFVAEGGDFRDWRPGWNIRPTDTIAVVIESAKGTAEPVRRVEPARWSLVPPWSKEIKTKFPTFNARSEGITEKSTWRTPVRSHRALIPADGYYEWHTDPTSKKKTPYYLHPPTDETLALAGLYSWWKNPSLAEDDPRLWTLTATILTSNAVDELVHIHDRNPVPLPRDWWDHWLDPTVEGTQGLVDAAVAAALPIAASLQITEVAPLTSHDGPELVTPV
jgi:putative SOS response-associated peptidase YedK